MEGGKFWCLQKKSWSLYNLERWLQKPFPRASNVEKQCHWQPSSFQLFFCTLCALKVTMINIGLWGQGEM